MVVVGLTGDIGTGKSTVALMFEEMGAKLIDADKIAHRMLWRNSPCFEKITRKFGSGILTHGRIDRKKLAGAVFDDVSQLEELEKIIHPQVIRKVERRLETLRREKKYRIVVLDVPLLFESGMDKLTDVTITVYSNRINQVQRLLKKGGLDKKDIAKRSKRQMPLALKKRKSDFIINNNSDLKDAKSQVMKIWNILYSQQFK